MPIIELFLSITIPFLLTKLTSKELLNFARREKIHTLIKNWHGMLLMIEAVLSDAEDKQMTNKAVRLWLEELQDLAYDLDDVLDEFAYEELKLKLDGLNNDSKIKSLLPSCCTSGSFTPSALKFSHRMRSKIKDIDQRLTFITKQRNDLCLVNIPRTTASKYTTRERDPSTSLITEPHIWGRDREKKDIIEFLMRDDDEVGILPIVGMGGLGKTTLAQAVYDDEEVKEHFKLKAWVCVSEELDIMRVTKAILESVTSSTCSFDNLDQVQVELKKSLAGKKFLIVLDDVWNNDYNRWKLLKSPFNGGAPGSKIIVTTRDSSIAKMMETTKQYSLKPLSPDDCWSVFSQHAFGNKSMDENSNLVDIGRKIVKKCGGLPLAASTLGGLLKCKDTAEEWKDVLDSKIWLEKTDILPALRLSYRDLPSHLKPCFAYCSILPKDYRFAMEELIYLWMAEGFVQQETGEKQIEDIAQGYFRELLSRSLFQPSSSKGNIELFVMHDLVNDLAQVVAGDVCFRLEDKPKDEENLINFGRARYASYMQGNYDRMEKFESFCKTKCLRTLLPFSIRHPWSYYFRSHYYLGRNVPLNLLPKLKFIRAFSLRGYRIYVLPDSVGDMKHLRYLDLSFTYIETLPDWVQTLYNLQTLLLRKCKQLKKLPKDMGNLVNLRHFDITNSHSVREMPLGVSNWKSLNTLSDFIVTEGNGSRIKELGKLNNIKGELRLSGLHNVTDPFDAKESFLVEKEHLDALTMDWGQTSDSNEISTSDDDETPNEGVEKQVDEMPNKGIQKQVLDLLQPHNQLKQLRICRYHGAGFSTWLGNPRFSKMVHIEIKDCRNCTALPPLGQLKSLKKLYIQGMSSLKKVGLEFYGSAGPEAFPVLEILSFKDCRNCTALPPLGQLKSLKELYIQGTSSLKQVGLEFYGNVGPEAFPVLEILSFHDMPEWEDWFAFGADEEVLPFARLNKLVVKNCPKLSGKLPSNLPDLELLEITKCQRLVVEFDDLVYPSLSSLCVDGTEIPLSPSVLNKFENTHGPISVSSLRVKNISMLGSFSNDMSTFDENDISANALPHYPSSVVHLEMENVRKLVYLPKWLTRKLKSLKTLKISECPELVSLFEEEEDEEEEEERDEESKECQEREQKCMLSLESLKISSCEKLEKLPRWLFMFRSLVKLSLSDCPKLVSFPETGFPSALRTLKIRKCEALESPLPLWNNDNNLETLDVFECPSLVCLASSYSNSSSSSNIGKRGCLPSSLKELYIWNCDKLEALIEGGEEMKINCPSLESIDIWHCESLGYLPDTLHDDSLGKLSKLRILKCKKLGYLPDGWTHAMTNLTEIDIIGCNNLRRIVSYIVKDASVFTNLTHLWLSDITVGKMHPSEWGLHRLSSLRLLGIEGPIICVAAEKKEGEEGEEEVVEVSVFPLQGMLLPTSLTELAIWKFPDLVRLSFEGFECLGSLERLWLNDCPRLAYLPEGGGGGSGWLPSTLLQLHIIECPKLKEKCERGKGQYWPIISHIPYLNID